MGVSMSKPDHSSSELSESGQSYERVLGENDKELRTTEMRKFPENSDSYLDSDRSQNGLKRTFPKPLGQETEVLQMLCAADDDELDDRDWKDIYQRLKTDSRTDLYNANTKFCMPKENKGSGMRHAGPVSTSTVAERPARVNSSNFSPHSISRDTEPPRYQTGAVKNINSIEDGENISDVALKNSTTVSSERGLTPEILMEELQSPEKQTVVSDTEPSDEAKAEIDQLLGIDTEIKIPATRRKSSGNSNFLSIPSISRDTRSPTLMTHKDDLDADSNPDAPEGLGISRKRGNSVGNISVYSVKEISDELYREYFYEIRKCIRSHGFFEKFPTPLVISDAQMTYRKLDLPTPADDDGNILPHPPKSTKQDVFATQTTGFSEIDIKILNAPQDLVQDSQTSEVIRYLCHDLNDSISQIRAISTWLAVRQLQTDGRNPGHPESWCKIFRTMCRKKLLLRLSNRLHAGSDLTPSVPSILSSANIVVCR